ncbi:hypothetical protein ACQP2T_41300 [Nonomuraea sp. CA-143628]|uniref:hypothetical protein n=1 Tax=Nonomuraea sp. CA-143628 TaxID=3239997 RepID=UPI003D8F9EDA
MATRSHRPDRARPVVLARAPRDVVAEAVLRWEEALFEAPVVAAALVEEVPRLPEAVRRPEVAVPPEAVLFGAAVLLEVVVLFGVVVLLEVVVLFGVVALLDVVVFFGAAELLDVVAGFCSVSLFGVAVAAVVAVAVRLRAAEVVARPRVVADVVRLRVPDVVARPRAVEVVVRLRVPEVVARPRVVEVVVRPRVPDVVARAVVGVDACVARAGVPLSLRCPRRPSWPRRAISAPAPMAAATGQSSTPNAASAPSAP